MQTTKQTNKPTSFSEGLVTETTKLWRAAHKNWLYCLAAFLGVVIYGTFRTFQRAITCAPVDPYAPSSGSAADTAYDSRMLSCIPAEKHVSWLVSLPFAVGLTAVLALVVLWSIHLLRLAYAHSNRDEQGFPRTVRVSEFFEEINSGLMLAAMLGIVSGAIIGFIISMLS